MVTQAQTSNVVCFDYTTTICVDIDKIVSPKRDYIFDRIVEDFNDRRIYTTNHDNPYIVSYIEFPWIRFDIGKAKRIDNYVFNVPVRDIRQVIENNIKIGNKIISVSDFDNYYIEGYHIVHFIIKRIKIVDIEVVRNNIIWVMENGNIIEDETQSMIVKAFINGFIVINMWFGEQYVNNVNVVAYIVITAQNHEIVRIFNEIYVKRTNINVWKKIDWTYIVFKISEIFTRMKDSIIFANIVRKYNVFKYYKKIGKVRIEKIVNPDTKETEGTWITVYYCPKCKKYMMGVAHVISHIYHHHRRNNNK